MLSDGPVEIRFEYPLLARQVVDGFTAVIGDKEIEAVIKNKEEA